MLRIRGKPSISARAPPAGRGVGDRKGPLSPARSALVLSADLILVDNRVGTLQPAELKPTWARLPAVQADQTIEWANEERFSHAGYARRLEQLATALEESKPVTG